MANDPLPPLNGFRAFEAAARHLNFTAAGRELGLTQSAVSQQVRALEVRLGCTLFERLPRGLALTDGGRALLPEVHGALEQLARAAAALSPAPTERQSIHLATSASLAQWLIAPALPDFHCRWPLWSLHLHSHLWPDEFPRAQADVELRYGPPGLAGQGAELLAPDRLVAVAVPAIAEQVSDWGALHRWPLFEAGGTSDNWARYASSQGEAPPAVAASADAHGLVVQMAMAGSGVALTSALVAARALADGSLAALALPAVDAEEGYYLRCRSTADAAVRVADWLVSLAQRALATGGEGD